MLRQKSKTQHLIPVIRNAPSTYFHLYTHGLTYTNPRSDTLVGNAEVVKQKCDADSRMIYICKQGRCLLGMNGPSKNRRMLFYLRVRTLKVD